MIKGKLSIKLKLPYQFFYLYFMLITILIKYIHNLLFYKRTKKEHITEEHITEELKDILSNTQLNAINKINHLCSEKHELIIERLNKNADELARNNFISKFTNSSMAINFNAINLTIIANDTHYRNQFETGTSSGFYGLKDRAGWEASLFSNIYGDSIENGFDRPKYGNLMINHKSQTGYGCAYFVLKDDIKDRTTFTLGDSGNNDYKSESVYSFKYASASYEKMNNTTVPEKFLYGYEYIEIQIHGPIRLNKDIKSLHIPRPASNYNIKDIKKLKQKGIQIVYY